MEGLWAQPQKGDLFPLEQIKTRFFLDYQSDYAADATLVAFVPSVTEACSYARMMRLALEAYFVQGLAWKEEKKTPRVQLLIVAAEEIPVYTEAYSTIAEVVTVGDPEGEVFGWASQSMPDSANAASSLWLLNKVHKVVYRDPAYRHESAQLRQLEQAVQQFLELAPDFVAIESPTHLAPGDLIPDIALDRGDMLLDIVAQRPTILAFYPAPLTGTFLPEVLPVSEQTWWATQATNDCASMLAALEWLRLKPVKRSKKQSEEPRFIADTELPLDAEIIVLTASHADLLRVWELELGTEHLRYVQDEGYRLAQEIGAWDADKGGMRQAVAVLNTEGHIIYLDLDFKVGADDLKALHRAARGEP